MAVKPCIPWPDPRLTRKAEPVDAITDDIRTIWQDMVDTMDAMPGYGLAAPQLGILLQLAVVDCSTERGKAIRMANPEILSTSTTTRSHVEASPNLPGLSAKLDRPADVTVAFIDVTGLKVCQDFEGLWATSVQHQIDHLNGKLFVHRLSRVKRDMLLKKAAKGRG
ncbi:peptide deformylase [Actibacterium sp. 188UL27-1]|uniref:peptide deformylase n=1 Tax=Actibacterium sp. 188UL27-1 TaxID=2786961 RepID=UPI00195DB743|nr:peptide deformylase [Actibacterium sp. 188UL27-1]MBM7069113.1 peptide deformylase [Actibacterium sp. 188UL27-1]